MKQAADTKIHHFHKVARSQGNLRNDARVFSSVVDMVGNTPLVEYHTRESGDARIFVKLESYNPTGSIKDRACVYIIKDAINRGLATSDKVLLDASSGNMACALAYFGRVMGFSVKVVCNSKLTADKRQFIEYFGAELEMFGDLTIEGNRRCRAMAEQEPERYCFLDQLHNPANVDASFFMLGPEILRDIPDVTAVVGSMGSGGSMCGVAKYITRNAPATQIFTCQAAPGTKIPGTGGFADGDYITPFIRELINAPLQNDTFMVNQAAAEQRTRELAMQGIFVGFQGGAVLDATLAAIAKHGIKGNVVMVIGDSGWKNMEKLMGKHQ
ncbi:MAG: pyridoxal-phosphate dependent enzyme [Gammaproteobacteria bacterium]|nr:pyridoxal-phosphate dependent enzyme [Gammaproteobacteria bacterium]